ncbi:MAG: hypothetical protein IT233_09240 [Bacteroidia bacterium]|nr:hypothetical protein [Bacteroidia bacterium]
MKKEIAKFLCGLTAWESIVHLSFGLSGNLPFTIFGITLTPAINTMQIIIPAIISFLLGYYAWRKNRN